MNNHFFKVQIENHIAQVAFNRPEKSNALHLPAWEEMQGIFEQLHTNNKVRVIVLSGEGKYFCAGIDLTTLMDLQKFNSISCEGRKREALRNFIVKFQNTISAIEHCRKPVLAAIHKACVGGGVDIVSACDMRYCTEDAYFSIKEIDLGLVADIGTLQRLPTILNPHANCSDDCFQVSALYSRNQGNVAIQTRSQRRELPQLYEYLECGHVDVQ